MKAIRVYEPGGPEVLKYEEYPDPVPGPGQVLINVQASGVNYMDVGRRKGPLATQQPPIPGGEAAGTVAAVGQGVTEFAVGDLVGSSSVIGGYAEQALAPAARTIKLPGGTEASTAAAALLQGMTAHALAFDAFPLKSGDKALVHAGAGGVGLLLIQMAKMQGAYVYATVSTEQKAALATSMGADKVILYSREDFAEEINKDTAGEGIQVIYDSVGLDTFAKGMTCLGRRGWMVLYGGSSGPIPPVDLGILGARSLVLTRASMNNYTATREELLRRASDVLSWIASGQLKLNIHKTYPLAEAAEAHRELEGRQTTGKLLLIP
ncbi:MAG: quinone oxidoreductase [Chloroflexi bacterium]|nr:quinone oxidoreductase [Chloroflexota bacterium]